MGSSRKSILRNWPGRRSALREGEPATRAQPWDGRALQRAFAVLLALVSVALVVAACIASVLISKRQTTLEKVSRYNLTWVVGQVVPELARFESVVAVHALPGTDVGADTVQLWLDILNNRLELLGSGEVREFLDRNPAMEEPVDELRHVVAELRPLMSHLDEPGVAQHILELTAPLPPQMMRLSAAAYRDSSEQNARDLRQLTDLHRLFTRLLLGIIICALIPIGALTYGNRLLRQAHDSVQRLVRDLRRSGEALSDAQERTQAAMREVQVQNRVLQQRDREMHQQNTRFDAALNNMSQGLCMADANGRLIVCNVPFLELFEIPPPLAQPGTLVADLFRTGQARRAVLARNVLLRQQAVASRYRAAEFVEEDGDGSAIEVAHEPMDDGGWVATYEDVSERRRAEASIRFLAHHDVLTRLPNRLLFHERVEQALATLRPGEDEVALLCLDLDQFKLINDTLGHPAGDALLVAVGQRLQGCVRQDDVVARLSGDEFAILHVARGEPEQAEKLASRIIDVLSAPYSIVGRSAVVGVSVGIAVTRGGGVTAEAMLRNADMALYRAKEGGRGTYRVFEAAMEESIQARALMQNDLRDALFKGELEPFYQPFFDLNSGRLSGFESLLRWRHPQRGMVSPGEFIPLAEEIGLIVPMGDWVLKRACTDARDWPAHVKVAVNLSPLQFQRGDIVAVVREALQQSGLPPARLELEITESTLLQDNERVVATLGQLRELGISTALDDFGTGYSSLSYLRSFAFDKIKIDQSFVREMSRRPDSLAIVNSVAALARTLGMTTTAEGIERPDQLRQVREAGCTQGQGYLLGRPRPASELGEWLHSPASPHVLSTQPPRSGAVGSEVPGPEALAPAALGPAPLGPEPLGPEPLGPEPLGPTPLGPEPLGPEPLGTEAAGSV
ncbi:putative bifunctional diguanylate cyclase/phosphodiesterase [Roseomonas elaeocarpi]|uniref:Bifunctional diguanylate cyclase/phosphodiesterase n=1 Tax=Roseomonas elaeocarpi TaxID=907779 RepID=A0ABV6JNX6_9PROT